MTIQIKSSIQLVTAFAPASSSNLSVGYDLLGFAFSALGDEVTISKRQDSALVITDIESEKPLPQAIEKNTAGFAIQLMLRDLGLTNQGFNIKIKKGIPLCSGLGGSAASSVAAVYALNQFLEQPLAKQQLVQYPLKAEALACGASHPDNVVPSLWGTLTLITASSPLNVIELPKPNIEVVLVHPNTEIPTELARAALADSVSLENHIKQSGLLAGMIASLYDGDGAAFAEYCHDQIIEPQRAHLLAGFTVVKQAAMIAGAKSCSFSGAGPTLYAFAENKAAADRIKDDMQQALSQQGLSSQAWIMNMQDITGPEIRCIT